MYTKFTQPQLTFLALHSLNVLIIVKVSVFFNSDPESVLMEDGVPNSPIQCFMIAIETFLTNLSGIEIADTNLEN